MALVAGMIFSFYACAPDKDKKEEQAAVPDKTNPANIFAGDSLMFTLAAIPVINSNLPDVEIPAEAMPALTSLAGFLKANPGYQANITGHFTPTEGGIEGFENLGQARAQKFADSLIALGVDPAQLVVAGEMKEIAFDDKGKFTGGYLISLAETPAIVKNEFDHTVFFHVADDLMRHDTILKDYIPRVGKYLADNPNIKMILTGHTDYNGNERLGEMRAEELMDYFVIYGIPADRIVIRSEGPDKPIAPNDTQENKSKNRRVEITFE